MQRTNFNICAISLYQDFVRIYMICLITAACQFLLFFTSQNIFSNVICLHHFHLKTMENLSD
jgi:hypothetical protein